MTPFPDRPAATGDEASEIGEALLLAFAPIHKRAFGMAVGLAAGLLVAIATAFHVAFRPNPAPPIGLLAEYFYGYTVSWVGVAVGFFWGFVSGSVVGWFTAFVRNLVIATWLFLAQAKAELQATRDFLDHI